MRESLYKLKKEAVPFFKEDLATKLLLLSTWKEHYNIDENALEEVKPTYIKYGHDGESSNSLSGWSAPKNDKEGGARFNFTICFPSMTMREHDEFEKGRTIRGLMEMIQERADMYFLKFKDPSLDE